jgi:hypothetical protein
MKIFNHLAALLLLVGYAYGDLAAIRGAVSTVSETTPADETTPVAAEKVRSNASLVMFLKASTWL